ncbi:hypothetical protein MP228_000300 [Amoeboaphelidium protococcarum]|nr:hypothetical protein MP228_000300 [Amoeboaphelidium protococcarum]
MCNDFGVPLYACKKCKLVFYCNAECEQNAIEWGHGADCNKMKRLLKKEAVEADKLRHMEVWPGKIVNFWDEKYAGSFWELTETRNFMCTKYNVAIHFMEKMRSVDAYQKMEEYFLEMLRLCRSDNVGVRLILPAVYLMLGKEQECYDFIKWFQCYPVNGYDWGNMDLPFLNYEQHNFLDELPEEFISEYINVEMVLALALIKFRALRSLKDALNSECDLSRLPQVLLRHLPADLNEKVLTEKVQLVQKHFDILFERIDKHNRRIWRAILEPGPLINQQEPELIVQNTANEAYAIVRSFLRPWEWTEGAIEYLETRLGEDTRYDAEIQQF